MIILDPGFSQDLYSMYMYSGVAEEAVFFFIFFLPPETNLRFADSGAFFGSK